MDILRGLALAGILIENMAIYAGYSYDLQTLSDPLSMVVAALVQFLLEAKSYSLLALLFGWGVATAARRARSQGSRFVLLYLRRLLVLLGFGLLHGILIWFGDILALYALLGLFLVPLLIKRLPSRWILAAAGGALLFSIVLAMPGETMDAVRAWYEGATDFLRYNTHPESLYRAGTYAQITGRRVQDLLGANSRLLYYAGNVLGMFLLGFCIGQRRLFEQASQRPSGQTDIVRKAMWFGLVVGVPFNALYTVANLVPDLAPVRYVRLIRVGARTIGAPAMVVLYISMAMLLVAKARWRRRLLPTAYVGRMSLSNYLSQSVVCTLVFYGYGLGLYEQVGPVFGLIAAIVLYLGQVRLSEWWFDRYPFGPGEWLWRSLVYGRRQLLHIGDRGSSADSGPGWAKPVRIGVLALTVVLCLGAVGLMVWKSALPALSDRRQVQAGVTVVPLGSPLSTQSANSLQEGRQEALVVATPQVKPAVYRPSAIAASGDLVALASTFDAQAALTQIETLTEAPYLGRYPSSPGGRAAGDYMAEQFAAYGLQPAGDDGTFYQSFPVEYVALAAVPRLTIELEDGTIRDRFKLYQDYSAILGEYSGEGTAAGQVVWANDCAHEDFDLLDVVDKVVLCRDGAILQAQRNALEHGAVGLLLLANPEQRPPDFGSTYREPWTPEPILTFRVYPTLVQVLLAGQGTLTDLANTFVPFSLPTRVYMRIETIGSESCMPGPDASLGCRGRNILGVLPGRDPRYADQVIVLGAHYDHLGESPDKTVWPGANDNASGVAVLLEIARNWYEQGYVPRRTVLFAAWDAEEMGLLGSRHYVEHPRYPLESTRAMVQLDMVGVGADLLRVDGHGDLGDLMEMIAADQGIDVERTNLGRSDHVPFQAAGIPASLMIWAQDDDIPPHYHRPMDIPAIIDPDKLAAVGRVASISLLALAEGEPAIRDLLDRRLEAARKGDLEAFLATSALDRQAIDQVWLADLQALEAGAWEMQLDSVRVLGRTATARVSVKMDLAQEKQGTQARALNSALHSTMIVQFLHDGTAWKWTGSHLVRGGGAERQPGDLPRFSVAYPPGMAEPLDLVREAERRYAQINALLGLDGPGADLWLYPDPSALRMDTALSLPRDQDTWIGFRMAKATQPTTHTNTLTPILCQLALTEHGIDESTAPWLWHGLPDIVEAQLLGVTPAYLDDLGARNLIAATIAQDDASPDAALAWAAVEYLREQVGWQGIGEFIAILGQACRNGEPSDSLQEGSPVRCQNPDALSTAFSKILGIDSDTFESRWRQYWHDQLAAAQADLDAVLATRTGAVLAGDERAFLETLDAQVPGLVAEERDWFADLAEHPVDHFELTGKPLSKREDGSLIASVTMQYRLHGMSDRRGQATVPLIVRFTPTPKGYHWAGHPFEELSREHVHVLYPAADDRARVLAETLLPDVEATYLQLANELGIEWPHVLYVKIYDDHLAFRTSVALSFPSVEWIPAWTSSDGSIKVRIPSADDQHLWAVQAARRLLGQMGVESEWLLKGVSLYLADASNANAISSLPQVLEASLDGTLASLSSMLPDHRIEQQAQVHLSRSQALDTINYLTNSHPPGVLLQILQTHGRGVSIDSALRETIGQSLAEFEFEWAQSLARGHARPEWIEIASAFDPQGANQHVEYLAAAQFAGRQAGSPGDWQAIAYIALQFAELGLTPVVYSTTPGVSLPDPDLFLQRFPISYTTLLSSPSLIVSGEGAQPDETLVYRQHYVVVLDRSSKGAALSGQLVWVRDDGHQDMDLDGKIVLCRPSASIQSQVEWAVQRGASGLLLAGKKAGTRSALAKDPLPAVFSAQPSIPVLELTRQGTDRLLEIVGMTQESLASSPPALHLSYEVKINIPLDSPQTVQTANVLGLLPGTDPKLSQEVIIVGAHHDHVGNDPGLQYAGRNDNASGVGVLLEIARLWQQMGYRPQRSVLFAAWAAQEPGEIGARYYVEHPAYPLTSTIAVFQLESVGGGRGYFLEAQGDPAQEGFLRFTLQATEEWVDGRLSLTRPSRRSDHSIFREIGIPGILLTWRESSEDNLPDELADPIEPYRLGVTGRMTSLALMALAQ